MPFPEIADRLRRFFKIRGADEPATTIEMNRPLTRSEYGLIEWLLEHGDSNSAAFMAQLRAMHVQGGCSCGCPTIDLVVSEQIPSEGSAPKVLADFLGRTRGTDVGVLLFQAGGRLSCLEVYPLGDSPDPFDLPEISTLYRWEEVQSEPENGSKTESQLH
jgi:hypothetical protein